MLRTLFDHLGALAAATIIASLLSSCASQPHAAASHPDAGERGSRIQLPILPVGDTGRSAVGFDELEVCQDSFADAQNQSPAWDELNERYDIVKSNDPDDPGTYQVRIIGDTLNVSSASGAFEGVIRPQGQCVSNISEIVFDAREINLDANLAFCDAKIGFIADQINFGPEAMISIEDQGGGGLEIVSNRLRFNEVIPGVFNFRVYSGQDASTSRTFKARIGEFSLKRAGDPDFRQVSAEKVGDGLFRFSLDKLTSPGMTVDSVLWDVQGGEDAEVEVYDRVSSMAAWPLHFSAKLAKHFSISPYSDQNRRNLTSLIDQNRRYIEAYSEPQPLLTVSKILAAIEDDVDLDGNDRFFVPRQNLGDQIAALRKSLPTKDGLEEYTSALFDLIVRAYQSEPVDEGSLEQVRKQISTVKSTSESLSLSIEESLGKVEKLEQEAQATLVKIEQRKDKLKEDLEALLDRQRDATNVATIGRVASVAAAFTPVGPAAAAALSTGIGLVGEAVYQHNTDGISDIGAAVTTIAEVKKRSDNYLKLVKATQCAWQNLRASRNYSLAIDRGVTDRARLQEIRYGDDVKSNCKARDAKIPDKISRTGGTGEYLNNMASFASALAQIKAAVDNVPKPTQITLEGLEGNDETYKSRLAELAAIRAKQADYNGKIVSYGETIKKNDRSVVELEIAENALLSLDITNQADNARWMQISLDLWRSYVSSLYASASLLKRSYFYETGETVGVSEELNYYFEEESQYLQISRSGNQREVDVGDLKKDLNENRLKLIASISGVLFAIEEGYADYLSRKTSRDRYSVRYQFDADGPATDIGRRFVEALNKELERSFETHLRNDTAFDPHFTFYIPIRFPATQSPFAERFYSARVSNLELEQSHVLGDQRLRFTVQHPGFGKFYREDKCFPFDTRQDNVESRIFRTSIYSSGGELVSDPVDPYSDIYGRNFFSLYPGIAPYFLGVAVEPTSTRSLEGRSPPQIRSIEIEISLLQ